MQVSVHHCQTAVRLAAGTIKRNTRKRNDRANRVGVDVKAEEISLDAKDPGRCNLPVKPDLAASRKAFTLLAKAQRQSAERAWIGQFVGGCVPAIAPAATNLAADIKTGPIKRSGRRGS